MTTPPKPRHRVPAGRQNLVMSGLSHPYRGGSNQSQGLSQFIAPRISAKSAARYSRQIMADRARDLARNETLVHTAVRKSVAMSIGPAWLLQSRPDGATLGIDDTAAKDLGDQIEREFNTFAKDPFKRCDATMQGDFFSVLRQLKTEWHTVNEAMAVMIFRQEEDGFTGGPYQTAVQVIDTDRLSQPNGQLETEYLRDGISYDAFGAAISYHIQKSHPGDFAVPSQKYVWDEVPRFGPRGRPLAIHGFRRQRAEEGRGVTFFAPLIEKLKMRGKYIDNELTSATLSSMWMAFVRSGADPASLSEALGYTPETGDIAQSWQEFRQDFYKQSPVQANGVTVPLLMPGDSIEANTLSKNVNNLAGFNELITNECAALLSLFAPHLTGDYKGYNFSSMRAALNDIYSEILVDVAEFYCQIFVPIFYCVIDEAILKGRINIPDGCATLAEEPGAWLAGNIITPPRGYIDPEKEAKGTMLDIESGIQDPITAAAKRGTDYETTAKNRAKAREIDNQHGNPLTPRDSAFAPTNPPNDRLE